MRHNEPQIIWQTRLGKTDLYRADVNYPHYEDEINPEKMRSRYIVKYLPIIDSSSSIIRINPVLSEAFINKTFKNPYLNTAEHVCVQSGVIVLFFKEAFGDFHSIKRKNWPLIKSWITSMLKGLAHLHLHRIIHGDVKAANIIIDDDEAKLSDFGMSSIILGGGEQKYNRKMYTPSHRPPEVWTTDIWGLSADIWAAGCTIYEMIYGQPLFQIKDTYQEYLLQLNAWLTGNNEGILEFTSEWNNPQYSEINQLILMMLNGHSSRRPTIFDILKSPFFTEPEIVLGSSPSSVCSYESLDVCPIIPHRIYELSNFRNKGLLERLNKNLKTIESDSEIRMLVLCMYESYSDDRTFNPNLLRTLLLIVHILTHRERPFIFTLTSDDKERILKYCIDIQFNFINWNRFYGVYDKFYLHLPRVFDTNH